MLRLKLEKFSRSAFSERLDCNAAPLNRFARAWEEGFLGLRDGETDGSGIQPPIQGTRCSPIRGWGGSGSVHPHAPWARDHVCLIHHWRPSTSDSTWHTPGPLSS